MRYAQIRETDVANGYGIRTSLYVQGCSRHCKGCFNPETWGFEGGKLFDEQTRAKFIELVGREHIVGATILGGEPLEPSNIDEVTSLCKELKEEYPNKTIWLYSSYRFEEILEIKRELLDNIDVMVDGEFIEELKNFKLKFRGSSNQRILDIKKSLGKNGVVILEE